jgi:hypothetical protein
LLNVYTDNNFNYFYRLKQLNYSISTRPDKVDKAAFYMSKTDDGGPIKELNLRTVYAKEG